MTKQGGKKTQRRAGSIKTRRVEVGAAGIKPPVKEPESEDAAELRLQRLLKELDKLDLPEDEAEADLSADEDYPQSGRRWSDDSAERD